MSADDYELSPEHQEIARLLREDAARFRQRLDQTDLPALRRRILTGLGVEAAAPDRPARPDDPR